MIDFLRKIFGQPGSSSTAKERLRLVLMSDHLSLAPEMVEAMKRDFIDVISKYVQVDRDKIEVNFEQQDKALAMLANVPILAVNRQNEERKPPSTPSAPATGLPRRKRRRKAAASSTLAGPAPAT
ncbi:MAG TPA: cell division topological specificity factor MinE [Candidatus Aquilonibacter sp.]